MPFILWHCLLPGESRWWFRPMFYAIWCYICILELLAAGIRYLSISDMLRYFEIFYLWVLLSFGTLLRGNVCSPWRGDAWGAHEVFGRQRVDHGRFGIQALNWRWRWSMGETQVVMTHERTIWSLCCSAQPASGGRLSDRVAEHHPTFQPIGTALATLARAGLPGWTGGEPMHAIESKEAFHEVIHVWIVKPGWSDMSHGCDGSRWFVALVACDFARIVLGFFLAGGRSLSVRAFTPVKLQPATCLKVWAAAWSWKDFWLYKV